MSDDGIVSKPLDNLELTSASFQEEVLRLKCAEADLTARVSDLEARLSHTQQELVQAEALVRSSRDEWERTFDAVPDLIMILNLNHEIVMVNHATANALGISKSEAAGLHCFECFHSTHEPPNICPHARLVRDGAEHREKLDLPKFNGTFLVTVSPIYDEHGNLTGGIHIARDITDIQRAEAAVRESEERFRQIAESIEEVFWLALPGTKRQLIYVNSACRHVWGRTPAELCNLPDAWLESIHPEDRREICEKYRDFLDGCADFSVEYRVVRPDGLDCWVWDRAFMVKDDRCNERRVAGVIQDISQRRSHQERQRQLIEELKHFAYFVSHDLRAPLTNLKGFSDEIGKGIDTLRPAIEMALDRLPEHESAEVTAAISEDIPEALGFIGSSIVRMDHLINGVLKVSQLGRRELQFARIDMDQLVQEVLGSMAHQINRSGAEVTVSPLPEAIADFVSVEQIVANLLDNAIKYLDPTRVGRVQITGERLREETLFKVIDNGRGIDPAHVGKIFDIFERLGCCDVPGEGMGLSQVRTLLWRHGGRIWCDSTPGVGSVFCFTIANDAHERY